MIKWRRKLSEVAGSTRPGKMVWKIDEGDENMSTNSITVKVDKK